MVRGSTGIHNVDVSMEMDVRHGQTEQNIRDNMPTVRRKVEESSHGVIMPPMRASFRITISKDRESTYGQMEGVTMEAG